MKLGWGLIGGGVDGRIGPARKLDARPPMRR
jgi:hypothetical protein